MKQKNLTKASISILLLICALSLQFYYVSAQGGVLIATMAELETTSPLRLAEMKVDIEIVDQHATVKVMQIFENMTDSTHEGKYIFSLPRSASIYDFAVWDGRIRIPGVMMEKRRANKLYELIKQQTIDPGILQTTSDDESENGFSAKIFPINPYGTKRLEMEYTEDISLNDLTANFTMPLKPTLGKTQIADVFTINLKVKNSAQITFENLSVNEIPLETLTATENEYKGQFTARNYNFEHDISIKYTLNIGDDSISVLTHREPEKISAYDLRDPSTVNKNADGFFNATAIFRPQINSITDRPKKNVVILLDTSLSVSGDRLHQSVETAERFISKLNENDLFNLLVFNDEVDVFSSENVVGNIQNQEAAKNFIKNSFIGGKTNIGNALKRGIDMLEGINRNAENILILISDGNLTSGITKQNNIEKLIKNKEIRLFSFGIGAGSNSSMLKTLADQSGGYYEQTLETEDINFKLEAFWNNVSQNKISGLSFDHSENAYDIYQSSLNIFPGSAVSFIGRYKKPQNENLTIKYSDGKLSKQIQLPDVEVSNPHLARLWARARVNALVTKINRDGEDEKQITEIIKLSEKYKFVTPYTAFIAAPRALLRPRLIQPGDPVIRVKTDPSITDIFVVLPFGETMPMRFIESEKLWETRFLAPVWMADGTYNCRLLLTDQNGSVYQEEKSFVIDSKSPSLKLYVEKRPFRAGESIKIKIMADADTNRITAKFYGAQPADLRWSSDDKANVGNIIIPSNISAGIYTLTIAAEDHAHNHSTIEQQIEILGGR